MATDRMLDEPRPVLITEAVRWFLQNCASSDPALNIRLDIERVSRLAEPVMLGSYANAKHNCLLRVMPHPAGPKKEMVLVWSGPHDGFFFRDHFLDGAAPWTLLDD